jgi:hypothetical protein
MKSVVIAGIAGLLSLSGCAPVHYTKADIDGRIVCNVDAVAQVEQAAKRNYATVHWVNCPTAKLRVI